MPSPKFDNGDITVTESVYPPSILDKLLFFLLFSGPPKFRLRDPNDSLDSLIDWVVILHAVVWTLAGLWIVSKVWLSKPRLELRFSSLEKLSLLLVGCLSVSIFFSEGPALTAFKVYQLLASILFASVYSRRFGVRASLDAILFGSAVLCVADVIAAFVAPDMVFVESEFGSLRFRGDLIAQTGVVGTLGLVLLLSSDRRRSWLTVTAGIALFGSVLLFSLMRTSYIAFAVFLLLALWKAPEIKLLKRVARWALLILPLAVVGGALAQLEEYRAAESIWSLSDRVGLWSYLIDKMWAKSPWFGLGYFSASRVYGPEYNVGLGTAHSVFVEVLSGGGVVSFTIFMAVWGLLFFSTFRLLRQPVSATSFAAVGLLVVITSFIFIGAELESDPAGFTLWILVASVPLLWQQKVNEKVVSRSKLTMSTGPSPLPHGI